MPCIYKFFFVDYAMLIKKKLKYFENFENQMKRIELAIYNILKPMLEQPFISRLIKRSNLKSKNPYLTNIEQLQILYRRLLHY